MAPMRGDRKARAMDPLGRRALEYVRDNCPSAYATIPDPASYFAQLGEAMRDQVAAADEALATAPAPPDATTPEGWAERVGQANMAGLMTEERVFSEMVLEMFPAEETEDDEAGWTPLIPDSSALAQAESEETDS